MRIPEDRYNFERENALPDSEDEKEKALLFEARCRRYIEDEEYESAMTCAREGLAFDQSNQYLWYALGISLQFLDEPSSALTAFMHALEVARGSGKLMAHIGACHMELGEFAEAFEWFDRAGNIDNHDIESMINAGACLLVIGDKAGAFERFERAFNADERVAREVLCLYADENADILDEEELEDIRRFATSHGC